MTQVIFNDIQTRLLSLCTDLGLEGFADGLGSQFENYQCFCDSSTEDRLLLLLQREKQVRNEKKILLLTKAAKLRDTLTYDALSLREADGLPKSTLQMLISNIWMHNAALSGNNNAASAKPLWFPRLLTALLLKDLRCCI